MIDFIDMEATRNQRDVENRLRDALKYDRARVQTGKISRFGLMELSRQRLQTSLGETSHISCPRCNGTGHIRSIESSALHILRILQEEAMKDNTAAVHAQVPIDVATYLLNEKRNEFHAIETRLKVSVLLIPNVNLETPHYTISRLRHDELNQNEPVAPSYKMASVPVDATEPASAAQKAEIIRPQAAVQGITPSQPAPAPVPAPVMEKAAGPSIFEKIFGWLSRKSEPAPVAPATRVREPQRRHGHERKEHRGRPEERKGGPRREPRQDADARREPRQDNEARREQPRNRPASATERRPERPQPQQNARPPRPDLAAVEQRLPGDRPDAAKEGEGRGRRRRGRRDRNGERSEPRQEQRAPMANAPVAEEFRSTPVSDYSAPTPDYLANEVVTQRPVEVEATPIIVESQPMERPSAPAPVSIPEVAEVFSKPATSEEKEPDEEPKAQAKPAPATQPAWKMEPVSLPTDLVMIETQSEKIQPIHSEAPAVRPARPPRRRVEHVPEEMLQQVETGGRPADQVGKE